VSELTATAAGPVDRFAGLQLVPDGDGYIVGSPHSTDFIAVPDIGGRVLGWLRDGVGLEECATRAAALAGEPVDVAGFLTDLEEAGLLPPPGAPVPVVEAARPPRGHRLGRLLFGRTGLLVQGALAVAGVVLLVAEPALRPVYTDAIVTGTPLASILIVTVIGIVGGLLHELAHYLAAAARGVRGSISLGRRLYSIVYQTDLTGLWSLPRRARFLPLAAGMLSDAAVLGALVALLASPWRPADPLTVDLLRAVVFAKFSGIIFQAEVFMRTDLYAMISVSSGCRNLWATKGAVARRLIRRPTAEDIAHLDSVSRAEIRWGAAYLALYVPGVAGATWYFVTFAVPALAQIVTMSVSAVADNGPLTLVGAAGALAVVLAVVPTGLVLFHAGRSGLRVLGRVLRR
jgi:putative peptide zinc metalloprotease protein